MKELSIWIRMWRRVKAFCHVFPHLEMEDRPLYYNIKTDHILFPFFFFFFDLSFSNGEFSTLITVEALFFLIKKKKVVRRHQWKKTKFCFLSFSTYWHNRTLPQSKHKQTSLNTYKGASLQIQHMRCRAFLLKLSECLSSNQTNQKQK